MFCRNPIAVGIDTYDTEIKKAYHEAIQPGGLNPRHLETKLPYGQCRPND